MGSSPLCNVPRNENSLFNLGVLSQEQRQAVMERELDKKKAQSLVTVVLCTSTLIVSFAALFIR
jgi:hypothetical protein